MMRTIAPHPVNQTEFLGFEARSDARNGDVTIEWSAANHKAVIGQIQALIDRGVAFYKLSETRGIRKKIAARPIRGTGDIVDRRLLIKDADITKIIGSVGDLREWLAARSNMR
jgi:hypothetical protein